MASDTTPGRPDMIRTGTSARLGLVVRSAMMVITTVGMTVTTVGSVWSQSEWKQGGARAAGPSAGLDTSTQRLSDGGTFQVKIVPDRDTVPVHQIHSWLVHVETAAGEPVTDATLAIDGDMPQHRHGLPTEPRMTENRGNGDYWVAGLKFHMPGWWVVEFVITTAKQQDRVHFNLLL